MNIVIVIPARGASKRIPQKNIVNLGGKPLLQYTLDQIDKIKYKVPVVISSEDPKILKIAQNTKSILPLLRPSEFACDTSTTESVLIHVLETLYKDSIPEWIITLPPTSPFRKKTTIHKFIEALNNLPKEVDCLFTVTKNYGDFWVHKDKIYKRLFPDAPRRQQERIPLLEENSAIYATRSHSLHTTKSILGFNQIGFPIDKIEAFDINDKHDILLASIMLESGHFSEYK